MQFLLLTNNRFGVLSRITALVSSFGANIETVAVYPLGGSTTSVVHLTVDTSEVMAERLHRKLSRLVDVIEIASGSTQEINMLHHELTRSSAAGALNGAA